MSRINFTSKYIAITALVCIPFACSAPVFGQQFFEEGPSIRPTAPPPPPPPPFPAYVPPTTPSTPPPVIGPVTPRFPVVPPVVVPTDVTQTQTFPGFTPIITPTGAASPAIRGIEQVAQFPNRNIKKDDRYKIFVFPKADGEIVVYKQLSPGLVNLEEGEVLVSVRKPAKVGHIETKFGTIAASSSSDIIIKFDSRTLRITNADSVGRKLKVSLHKGPFARNKTIVSVKPGYEMVVGNHRLTRRDLRPADGIARRHFQVLENGHLAVSEVSVASIVRSSDLLANLRQNTTGYIERRIIGDMSKMAAVLNHMNGTQGFTVEGNTRLASN